MGSHSFIFLSQSHLSLSFPCGLLLPFKLAYTDKMMWQNSQYLKVLWKRFKAGLVTKGTASQMKARFRGSLGAGVCTDLFIEMLTF